jgi:hypothetical protein
MVENHRSLSVYKTRADQGMLPVCPGEVISCWKATAGPSLQIGKVRRGEEKLAWGHCGCYTWWDFTWFVLGKWGVERPQMGPVLLLLS